MPQEGLRIQAPSITSHWGSVVEECTDVLFAIKEPNKKGSVICVSAKHEGTVFCLINLKEPDFVEQYSRIYMEEVIANKIPLSEKSMATSEDFVEILENYDLTKARQPFEAPKIRPRCN